MATVIRYINNGSEDVVAGQHVVPKFDQLITNEFIQAFDAMAGKQLVVLIDGVELTEGFVPAVEPVVEVPEVVAPQPKVEEEVPVVKPAVTK